MNLFFLDTDPKKCAEYHCDKHVVKMLLELVQLLYTAHHLLNSDNLPNDHYKQISNPKHPTSIWTRLCVENYNYTSELAIYLCNEYTLRYNKVHKCEKHAIWLRNNIPKFEIKFEYKPDTKLSYNKYFESIGITPVPLAMPEDSKCNDPIISYRTYYKNHKTHFVKWTLRPIPMWFTYSDIRKYF
jgi:hypothetical protein